MSDQHSDDRFMARALEIAATAKDEPGALPYGAVVVIDGEIVGEGLNRAAKIFDPTSHGEIEAIRDACRKRQDQNLTGAVMYTTAEPCPICVATMLWSGFERLVFAAAAEDTASYVEKLAEIDPKFRRRYSAAELREQVGRPADKRDMPMARAGREDSLKIFDAFIARRSSG